MPFLVLLLVPLLPMASAGCGRKESVQRKPLPSPEALRALPPDGGPDYNRLVFETSPYLLAHATDPVDWYPWGPEAFEKAKREKKPILLSVGYSACHGCHVMAQETFGDPEVAGILNASFVAIQVDREERPDIDEVYMKVALSMLGRGAGWPNNVFLTPEMNPLDVRSYVARDAFVALLREIAGLRNKRPEEVERRIARIRDRLREPGAPVTRTRFGWPVIEDATEALKRAFDHAHGGFTPAPKFPSAPVLSFLLQEYQRTGNELLRDMVETTLERMALGGIRDQVGGGFHRYATDPSWCVPHFEKMLGDNAILCQVYIDACRLTGRPLFRQAAQEALDWMLRDLAMPSGGFASSLDARSDGQDGRYYLWTQEELDAALGTADAALLLNCGFALKPFPGGGSVLTLRHLPGESSPLRLEPGDLEKKMAGWKATLLAARERRGRPALDDKILTSWNGLLISTLASGYQAFGDERYLHAAQRAMSFLLDNSLRNDRLLAVHRAGQSRVNGYLDDYAFVVAALIDLYESTFDTVWFDHALRLNQALLTLFWDEPDGAFFFVSRDHDPAIPRLRKTQDGPFPSGHAIAAVNLLRLAALTGDESLRRKSETALQNLPGVPIVGPLRHAGALSALASHLAGPREIAIAGPPNAPETRDLLNAVYHAYVPNRVLVLFDPGTPSAADLEKRVPWVAGKKRIEGKAAAYVCENGSCKPPVTTPKDLLKLLTRAGK
jgi:uncharacterized protein YyaL (SSP411 family)